MSIGGYKAIISAPIRLFIGPSCPEKTTHPIGKGYGIFAEILKDFLEGVDTFAGRYLAFFSP